jgi:N-acetyl-gamma-glutamyl-phosphate reductase
VAEHSNGIRAADGPPGGPAARVLVAGATGYTGALAAELVRRHPQLELAAVTARSETGTPLSELYPRYRVDLELQELTPSLLEDVEAAIVAYPHGASAPVVAEMRGMGLTVVDLSADFRFEDRAAYELAYGAHSEPELLEGAVYGLPELNREAVRQAELIACPGCYPTASLIALAPLAEAGLLEDVVIDAKSGVSGAGRNGGEGTSFVQVTENVSPYKPAGHRHRPEISEKLAALSPSGEAPGDLTFVPHLVPVDEGELVSCYVKTTRALPQEELDSLYGERYDGEPFVDVTRSMPGMRDVRGTNRCRVSPVEGDARTIVFASIDNLWKGAASQAIQNLNLALGLDETAGLT